MCVSCSVRMLARAGRMLYLISTMDLAFLPSSAEQIIPESTTIWTHIIHEYPFASRGNPF